MRLVQPAVQASICIGDEHYDLTRLAAKAKGLVTPEKARKIRQCLMGFAAGKKLDFDDIATRSGRPITRGNTFAASYRAKYSAVHRTK